MHYFSSYILKFLRLLTTASPSGVSFTEDVNKISDGIIFHELIITPYVLPLFLNLYFHMHYL